MSSGAHQNRRRAQPTPTCEMHLSPPSRPRLLPSPSLHPLKLSLRFHVMTNAALSLPRVLLLTAASSSPSPSLSLISAHSPLLLFLCRIPILYLALTHCRGVFASKKKKRQRKIPDIWKLRHKMVSETDVGL